jgi:hypothetical protein
LRFLDAGQVSLKAKNFATNSFFSRGYEENTEKKVRLLLTLEELFSKCASHGRPLGFAI